ncbi:MAG: AraC family transcriptional regulator [Armatimonadota bacterium]
MAHTSTGHREMVFTPGDFPIRAGWFQGKGGGAPTPYYHNEIEFQLVCRGQGQYFIHNQIYAFQRNSVLIIHRNEVHNYLPHPDAVIERVNLIFSLQVVRERPAAAEILHHLLPLRRLQLSEKAATTARLLLNDIAEECRGDQPFWQASALNSLEQFLIILSRAVDAPAPAVTPGNPVIRQVIEHLEERFPGRVLLPEVAEQFHISSFALCREFKKYAGMGFKQYLLHRRVMQAKVLLEETEMKIAAIATAVGFDDLSSFNRAFKALVGVTPSDYRKISQ